MGPMDVGQVGIVQSDHGRLWPTKGHGASPTKKVSQDDLIRSSYLIQARADWHDDGPPPFGTVTTLLGPGFSGTSGTSVV